MNDFTEIESELRKLRPRKPSAQLLDRIERALSEFDAEVRIVRPSRFQFGWLSLGAGLAAAALILFFLHVDFRTTAQHQVETAAISPPPRRAIANPGLVPAAATQVVYHTSDEGLFFPSGSQEPVRRMRSFTHETLQWRNASTGASLRVSYPTEQVQLIPVSGQ